MNGDGVDRSVPQIRITDPVEPSLGERLRTPFAVAIYGAKAIDLLTEAAEMIETLKGDIDSLRSELQSLTAENQRQRDYCSEVERNRDELYHERDRLKTENNVLREELQRLVREQMARE